VALLPPLRLLLDVHMTLDEQTILAGRVALLVTGESGVDCSIEP
jgi:hypothetical protein